MARQGYYIITTDDSVPASTAGTGTISTSSVCGAGQYITGSSTDFTSELERGAYLIDLTNHEVRKVKEVIDDELLIVDEAFSNDLSGVNLKYVSEEDAQVVYMEIDNTGGSDTTINNVAFGADKVFTDGQPDNKDPRKLVVPKIVDGATSNCTVTLTYNRN